jgi:hypothetical protein
VAGRLPAFLCGGRLPCGRRGLYPDLESRAGLRDRLLQTSVQAPGMALVEPGFPEGSYLYQKVREDFATLGIGSGNPMPTGAPLSASQRTALQTWIEGGAPE